MVWLTTNHDTSNVFEESIKILRKKPAPNFIWMIKETIEKKKSKTRKDVDKYVPEVDMHESSSHQSVSSKGNHFI